VILVVVWLVIFWAMQALAQVLFKLGAVYPQHKVLYFILGNIPGASSIVFLMLLYRRMNPNLALALGGGGSFIACQIALSVLFRAPLAIPQYAAMLLIAAGMALFPLGATPEG